MTLSCLSNGTPGGVKRSRLGAHGCWVIGRVSKLVYFSEVLSIASGRGFQSHYSGKIRQFIQFVIVWTVLNAFLFRCLDRRCTGWRRLLTGKDR